MARRPAKKPTKKRVRRTASAKKAAAKKAVAKQVPAKKAAAKKATATRMPAKKTAARRAATRKSARTKSPARKASARRRRRDHRPQFAADEAVIRMYRQGIGDCFVVFLPQNDGTFFKMMIDCGVLMGTPDAQDVMRSIVRDIIAASDGEIDVLVVTHEHWDHVSGFAQAHDLFAPPNTKPRRRGRKLHVKSVWLAWTEDPHDPDAQILQQGLKALLQKVNQIGMALESPALGLGSSPDGQRLIEAHRNVLAFFGNDPEAPMTEHGIFAAGADGPSKTRQAMDIAAGLAANKRFCKPEETQPWRSEKLPGLSIYTLGPPRDPKRLRRMDPGQAGYHAALGAPEPLTNALFAHAGHRQFNLADDSALDGRHLPGSQQHGSFAASIAEDFIGRHYYEDIVEEPSCDGESAGMIDQSWRRIDHDWFAGAADFALALDRQTNNTSLVLAIELSPNGPVLLFVADAQAGSWLSWHDMSWQRPDGSHVKAADLMARTTFLKVGHHGSHNATLKELGLELMTQKDFVAAVPVDRVVARKRRWNRMPLPSIMEELMERSGNRVAVSERASPPCENDFPTDALAKDPNITETDLYFEFRRPITF